MSFLKSAGTGAAAASDMNPISSGVGHMLNTDPSRVSMIADRIGNAANGIATAGGAAAGYGGQAAPPQQAAPVNNYMQMLDPTVLRAIMAKFGPAQNTGVLR